jgi:predicted metal-binding membrane protein
VTEQFDTHDERAEAQHKLPTLTVEREAIFLLLGAAVVAWAVTAERMRGMDAGPGTDLGALGWWLGVWVTMTVAMMLPSTAPAARHVARLARRIPTLLFVVGYLAVWTAYGIVAYGIFRLVSALGLDLLAWDESGRYLAGGVVIAAGLYELTRLKRRGLRRCRTPLRSAGTSRSGFAHGLDCVACSGGLMTVLFVLGVMSVFWMAVAAAVIFAEKVLPRGPQVSRAFAVALVVLGVWVAVAPASVPELTQPGTSMMERSE